MMTDDEMAPPRVDALEPLAVVYGEMAGGYTMIVAAPERVALVSEYATTDYVVPRVVRRITWSFQDAPGAGCDRP